MSVELFGVNKLKFRIFKNRCKEDSIWIDTESTDGTKFNMTVRITVTTFIRQMRLMLAKLEQAELHNESLDYEVSDKEQNVTSFETKANNV